MNRLHFNQFDLPEKKDVNKNLINQKILDSIIDDDDSEFTELISQITDDDSNPNQQFVMTNYKFPNILKDRPTYASLCALFCSEKCFSALSMICAEGLSSEKFQKTDNHHRSPIHFACAGGSLNIIRELYQAGFDLNASDYEGCLPSHYSAMAGTTDALKYLWSKGADVLKAGSYRSITPLHFACLYGNLDTVKFICEEVDKENSKQNYSGTSPLHMACEGGHVDIVDYFLASKNENIKKQIKQLDCESRTPLVVACQNGSLECVKSLFKDKNAKKSLNPQHRKHAPLIDAAAGGYADIVKFLTAQKEIDLKSKNSKKISALEAAILNGHCKVAEILIQGGATKGFNEKDISDLFLLSCGTFNDDMIQFLDKILNIPYSKSGNIFMKQACKIENESLISFLIEKGCNFDSIKLEDINFNIKWKPFMSFLKEKGVNFSKMCTNEGIPMIVKTIKNGSVNSVKEMISEGVELNNDIILKYNLIEDSCYYGDLNLFNFLSSYCPNFDRGIKCMNTLLQRYDYCKQNWFRTDKLNDYLKIAERILDNFNLDINNEQKIIDFAVNNGLVNFLELFINHGVKLNECKIDSMRMKKNDILTLIDFLIINDVNINNIFSIDGKPLIVDSFAEGDDDLVNKLLNEGFELNSEIITENDLFEKACQRGQLTLFNLLMKYKPTIDNPSACLERTFEKFHYCLYEEESALNERLEIAEILLRDFKADPTNQTIIEYAASYLFIEVLELLAKYNADFNKCELDYSKMIQSDHIPIFHLLEKHGCIFQKPKKVEYNKLSRHFYDRFSKDTDSNDPDENISPIKINFKLIGNYQYDIDTLLFLLKYSTNDDISNLKTQRKHIYCKHKFYDFGDGEKNIIDILVRYECYNGILDIYKKLNYIILPIKMKEEEYKQIIQATNVQELKDILFSE